MICFSITYVEAVGEILIGVDYRLMEAGQIDDGFVLEAAVY